MSRSRAARDLADNLRDIVGVEVRVSWENLRGRGGVWLVQWHDGPTVAAVRGHARRLVRWPLTMDALRFSRFHSAQATTAAMLCLADRGELPARPANATMMAESHLADTDTDTWAHLWAQAGELVEQANGDLYDIVALIRATVTKPRHDKRAPAPRPADRRQPAVTKPSHETLAPPRDGACRHCAAPLAPSRAGRPPSYCSPACRQAAHRAATAVTKPRHETTCAACETVFTTAPTGRPARHCSPTCRTRAWRRHAGHPQPTSAASDREALRTNGTRQRLSSKDTKVLDSLTINS